MQVPPAAADRSCTATALAKETTQLLPSGSGELQGTQPDRCGLKQWCAQRSCSVQCSDSTRLRIVHAVWDSLLRRPVDRVVQASRLLGWCGHLYLQIVHL